MPTLLQINTALNRGSTGRISEQIGLLAQKQGWEVYIAHGARYINKSSLKTIQVVTKAQEKLHAIKSMAFDSHGLGSRNATKRLVERIKEIKPDIIHLHNIHGYYLNYKVLFEYLVTIDTPIVWTLHDCWTMTGHCAHFDAAGCEKWKSGCFDCPLKGEYPKSILLDRSARNYALKRKLFSSLKNATIVPVSNWLEDIVKESYLGNYTINVINNGVDIDIFRPQEGTELRSKLGIGNKTVLLGVATAWGRKKGLYDYIELSKYIPDRYQIILVGIDDNRKKELPSKIIAIERTNSQHQLASLYSLADIVLNLSYEETFGLTTVEGFACGTPGIVYNKTASPELITPETGIVVEKGNFNELVKAVETICSKGKKHYTTACRERAVSLYNKDDRFNEYIKLYKTLMNRTH